MRVYMRKQDNEDKYAELDHSKVKLLPGDHLICHTEDLFHEASGTFMLENIPGVTIHKPEPTYSLEKSVSGLVFFTKLPHSVSIKRRSDCVLMTVTM